jgi:hypothetical protein
MSSTPISKSHGVTAALGTYFYYITVLTASLLHHTEYNTASIPLLLIHVFCATIHRDAGSIIITYSNGKVSVMKDADKDLMLQLPKLPPLSGHALASGDTERAVMTVM